MTFEDVASARKLVVSAMLVYVLWLLANSMFSFAYQLKRQHEQQQQTLQMLERDGQREAALLRQNSENLARQRLQTATPPQAMQPNRPPRR